MADRLARIIGCSRAELGPCVTAFAYFFCLLAAWYILRPVRDEMGIQGGVRNLQWLFTATFVAMLAAVPLYGWVSARFPRRRFVPVVYLFFIANLILFWAAFQAWPDSSLPPRVFFVWTSVFNLFVISVFWSLLADVFDREQAVRLFGFVAAGGSAGAIVGPIIATALVGRMEPIDLIWVSVIFLGGAIACVLWLTRGDAAAAKASGSPSPRIGGGMLEGFALIARSPYLMGICALLLLTTAVATFLYFQQAAIVRDAFDDPADRTRVFAGMDLVVNVLAVGTQLFATGRLTRKLGLSFALGLLPAIMLVGFGALALFPILPVLVVVQVLRRATNYAVMRPAREMLFTVVSPGEKYKAKSVIDTVVYRGGDALSGWVYAGLSSFLSIGAMAVVAMPIALAWLLVARKLGRHQDGPLEAPAAANQEALKP